jgi:hypothetical protein
LLRGVMHDAMLTWKGYVAGFFTSVGSGCPGSLGVPVHNASGIPELGETLTYTVSNVLPAHAFSMLIGNSTTQWASFGLPLNLDLIGAPVATCGPTPRSRSTGRRRSKATPQRMLAVPVNAALKGAKFHTQFLVMDPGANALGLVATRALTTTLGGS